MKTKLFFPLCAMIALPSVANALPAVLKKPGAQTACIPQVIPVEEAQTAMVPLCAGRQMAANVFKAMPVKEAQTACRYCKKPAANAQTAMVLLKADGQIAFYPL